jgi:hypothetical protein
MTHDVNPHRCHSLLALTNTGHASGKSSSSFGVMMRS